MRRCAFAIVAMLAGCAELGVIGDGTSVSVGTASRGYLMDGARLADHGEGYLTREVWRTRDNRFGTDELVDLVAAVARRMRGEVRDVKLVVADLSGKGGGERVAFHRSHQTGRDVDLLYYMRDAKGAAFEPDAMHVFNAAAHAVDGSGLTVDVPRTWLLVKEIVTAPEAPVQWIFMYEPIAQLLIEHATKIGEPEAVIARARRTLKQPGDSARHDDHLHVRVYCSTPDRSYGCRDLGPMELLAEREAEPARVTALVAALATAAARSPGKPAALATTRPPAFAAAPAEFSTSALPGLAASAPSGAAASPSPGQTSSASSGLATSALPGLASSASSGLASSASSGLASSASPGLASSASPGLASSASSGLASSASPGLASSASPGLGSSASPGLASSALPGLTSSASLGFSSRAAAPAASLSPGAASDPSAPVSLPASAVAGFSVPRSESSVGATLVDVQRRLGLLLRGRLDPVGVVGAGLRR